jgi:protein gp37
VSDNSAIEWTDATWNPVRGCTKVSPGCANCYAETFAERWRGVPNHPYTQGFDLRLVPEKLDEPLKWKTPKRIFVNSMSDLFQDGVPDDFIDRVFAVMAISRKHTFQLLTKRADRMRAYVLSLRGDAGYNRLEAASRNLGYSLRFQSIPMVPWPIPNVWLGVSVENQHFADERIPLLLQTPAAVRFLSCEPLLEGLDLAKHRPGALGLHWVIVGGESGHGARQFRLDWARSIMRQCQQADVAVFVKQLGANVYLPSLDKTITLDGRKNADITRFPEDLRIREFPSRAA